MNAHVGGFGGMAATAAKPKFKVGDRVRRRDGMTVTVEIVENPPLDVYPIFAGAHWYTIDGKSCVDEAGRDLMPATPTFKVGDRVRLHDFPYILHDNQRSGVVAETRADGRYEVEIDNYGDSLGFFDYQMAPFTIEAGKTYLTADGRRVGPMVRAKYGEGFTADNGARIYREDGKRIFGGEPTLVAEAPPVSVGLAGCAAAEVDNLRDEYGPIAKKAEPTFKVGDRVRVVGEPLSTKGAVGLSATIKSISEDARWPLLLKFSAEDRERHTTMSAQRDLSRATYGDVELIVRPTAIVALLENGQPKPATRPYVHSSKDAATTEADRLAGVHKGQEFGVFELVATRKVEKPTYEHEWQRLAIYGGKIAAIRELRRITGMGLKPAKDAVEYFLESA